VLLIIFMVVTPLLLKGVDVELPETARPEKMPEGAKQLNVAVKLDGSVVIGQLFAKSTEKLPPAQHDVQALFGDAILLDGYDLDSEFLATGGDRFVGRAGTSLKLTLHWESLREVPGDYTVFVHVPGEGGMLTADAPPLNGNYPTSAWQPGEVIEDPHPLPAVIDLKIPRAVVGLYRPGTGERLPIDGTGTAEFELIK
jgi:hypothetical protein